MESRLFIYTRTRYHDYRLLCTPKEDFVPENIRWKFIDFAREVINTDNPLNGNIENVRWSVFKIYDFALWGIGCMNSKLGLYNTDRVGTPIRGFFGFIIKFDSVDNILLPYDLNYFKRIYSSIIEPVWEEKVEKILNNSIDSAIFPNDINEQECISSNHQKLLNDKRDSCVVYSVDVDIKQMVGSVFSYSKNNFVSGLNRAKHAVESSFMNAVASDCSTKQIYNIQPISDIEKPQQCVIIKSQNDKETKEKIITKIPTSVLKQLARFIKCIAKKFNLRSSEVLDAVKQKLEEDGNNDKSRIDKTQEGSRDIIARKLSRDKINKLRNEYKTKMSESDNVPNNIEIETKSDFIDKNEIELQEVQIKDSSIDKIKEIRNEYNKSQEMNIEESKGIIKSNNNLSIEEIGS